VFTLHKFKRRSVYLSVSVMITCLLGFLVFYTFETKHPSVIPEEVSRSNWYQVLPLITICLYFGLVSFGYMNIPTAMGGELFPIDTKVFASGVISVASGAIAMVITKLGWIMEPWIWMSIFTGSALFSTIYSYILMPETQGLSLEEIKQLYKPILNEDKKRAILRRQSTFFGSLPNDNLVVLDDDFGDETIPDEAKIDKIKKKLQRQQTVRSMDMSDDATFRRRASTISGVSY